MKHKRQRWNVLILIAIAILVLVLIYSGLQILESTVLRRDPIVVPETTGKTIERDEVAYFPRQDMTVVMLSGVDTTGIMEDSGSYNNPAEADMISLLVFDNDGDTVDIISLNRDSMVDMPVLGLGGKYAGTQNAQLALAHTYGSGLDDSSINLRKTVSDLLYGLQIDYYVTINMDAIAVLNDAVGGVTVDVKEDFSKVDASIPMGKVKLTGQQAKNYLRMRQDVGDQMNLSRMDRHEEYIRGFISSLKERMKEDPLFLLTAYDQVTPYMVTDCTTASLSGLIDRYSGYALGDMVTPEGENVRGKNYMEFHLDEKALDAMILKYLYAPK